MQGEAAKEWAALIDQQEAAFDLEVYPENLRIYGLYQTVNDRWEYGAMGGLLKFDVMEARELLRCYGHEIDDDDTAHLHLFTRHFAQAYNAASK